MAEEATIVVREQTGVNAGRVHTLGIGRHVIGRDPAATIQLASTDVSRQHALLEVAIDAITISDLGSKNGILLKKKGGAARLLGPTRLADGAVVDVGGIELLIVHPGAQVDGALNRHGEATITRMIGDGSRARRGAAVWVPLLLTAMFAGLVGVLLWLE